MGETPKTAVSLREKLGAFVVQSSVYVEPNGKWIWPRIHKTAGTSVYESGLTPQCPGLLLPAKHPREWASWYEGVTDSDLAGYHLWTIVRNPYDRFLSMAAMFGKEPEELARHFDRIRGTRGKAWRHSNEQWKYIYHESGEPFVHQVEKFETLDDSFERVCRKLGLQATKLPHLNKSESRENLLSPRVRDFVERRFEKDFTLLGYSMNGRY